MKLRRRSCPLCGSGDDSRQWFGANVDPSRLDDFSFASRKAPEGMHHRMVCCPDCDLLYATPAPEPDWLEASYRAASFDAAEASQYAAASYAGELGRITANLPRLGKALDIGTGDGAFLRQLLAAGFGEVEGVEPSAAPIAEADSAIRPLIREAVFRASDYAAGQYSLVSCFQTLEHLDDPRAVCSDVVSLLEPGGAFLTVAHNYRAWLARLLGERSPILDVEHLQLFSPRSLRRLLVELGLSRVSVRPLRNTYPLTYWLRLAPLPGPAREAVLSVLRRARLHRRALPMWVGNMVAVGYAPS